MKGITRFLLCASLLAMVGICQARAYEAKSPPPHELSVVSETPVPVVMDAVDAQFVMTGCVGQAILPLEEMPLEVYAEYIRRPKSHFRQSCTCDYYGLSRKPPVINYRYPWRGLD